MKRSSLFFVFLWPLVAAVPLTICAQSRSGSVRLRSSISKTVTLSIPPTASNAIPELTAIENGAVLRLVVSGFGSEKKLIVPVLIRSNTAYRINASVQSQTSVLTQLWVLSLKPGGKLVAANAVTGVAIDRRFDLLRSDPSADEENLSTIDVSVPFTILRGPRISLSGGLNSPANALKVLLFLCVRPNVDKEPWTIELQLQGSGTDTP